MQAQDVGLVCGLQGTQGYKGWGCVGWMQKLVMEVQGVGFIPGQRVASVWG